LDPFFLRNHEAIEALNVLADKTRLDMLRLMKQYYPKGLTASDLSTELNKSIPTILHHLDLLETLKFAYYEMEAISDGKRKVKHWKLLHQKIHLEIDIDNLAFSIDEIQERIFTLFEEEKGAGGFITTDFASSLTVEKIIERLDKIYQDITADQAEIILHSLSTTDGLLNYVEKWIYREFLNSAGNLQLQFFTFGRYFALDDKLRGEIYQKLVNSPDFFIQAFQDLESGNEVTGIALRPEALKKLTK
jgi:DNA-binding transcriptional ArsR family regulator